jgi:hypothetical protein
MTAREQGRRIVKELEDFEAKFDLGQKLPPPPAEVGGRPVGIGAAAQFPAQYLYPDERDKVYAMRRALNVGAGRPDPITDDEIRYILDKTSGYETATFHEWFSRLYQMDDSNPVMKKWGMDLMPELWQMKEEAIDRNAQLQAQLAKIKLRGIRDRADLDLMYGIDKGAVIVPRGPIWDPKDIDTLPNARRGVFNPRLWAASLPREGDPRLGAPGSIGKPPYAFVAPPWGQNPQAGPRYFGFQTAQGQNASAVLGEVSQ